MGDPNQILCFKLRGIDKKHKDLPTDLRNKRVSNASLFIDDATICLPGANLSYKSLNGANLTEADILGIFWDETMCHDGTNNSGISPNTAEQLLLA